MIGNDPDEISLRPDYDRGRVGVKMGERSERLLPPEAARDTADLLEAELERGQFAHLEESELRDTRDVISDLRQLADDVE